MKPAPLHDPEAWQAFPRMRWVYNKLSLAQSQGLRCGPHGIEPDFYPVISRPIINLAGLGVGTRVYGSAGEFDEWAPGHFWCEVLEGQHRSTDLILLAGSVVWDCTSVGYPDKGFTFEEWDVGVERGPEWQSILSWLMGINQTHTGAVNLETIGDKIIEAHLRPSDQFLDLYPLGFVDCINGLFAGEEWRGLPPAPGGASIPIWFDHDRQRPAGDAYQADSVHLRIEPGESFSDYLNPSGGYQVGYVNNVNPLTAAVEFEKVCDHILTWPRR